jgi:hypothetical protein
MTRRTYRHCNCSRGFFAHDFDLHQEIEFLTSVSLICTVFIITRLVSFKIEKWRARRDLNPRLLA